MADWEQQNAELVKAVRDRGMTATRFGYGIVTADRYVAGVLECSGQTDTEKAAILKDAATKLTYSNEETVADVFEAGSGIKDFCKRLDVKAPKNTLMVLENVLTSSKVDRDGDIMRSDGAELDPNMPLLWHHMLPMPLGRMLRVLSRSPKEVKVATAIVDTEAGRDAATLVEFGALRFSHGFRPLKFQPMAKAVDPEKCPTAGFDVQRFEVMEESLVTVPSNTDAVITAFSRGKLHDPLMKAWAGREYDQRQKVFAAAAVDPWQARVDAWVKSSGETGIPVEVLEKFCPTCAQAARAKGFKAVKLDLKEMPEQMMKGLCESLGDDADFFTRCMEKDLGKFEAEVGDNKEGFCAWLHKQCVGKWPAEKPEKSAPVEREGQGDTPADEPADEEEESSGDDEDLGLVAKTMAESKAKEEPKDPHMNEDGTFKGGFDGCVAHFVDLGKSEEQAKGLCAKIARETGQAPGGKEHEPEGVKYGRVLSRKNEARLRECHEKIGEAHSGMREVLDLVESVESSVSEVATTQQASALEVLVQKVAEIGDEKQLRAVKALLDSKIDGLKRAKAKAMIDRFLRSNSKR